ncbi:MAG TPA: ABC transporter ATP-binding protein [bacterium]|nr:ABC transporter ATP-binding protein [bacterium]
MSAVFDEDPILGRAYDARLVRRLLGYVRPYAATVGLAIALLLLASLADLAGPSLYRVGIDRYIAPPSGGGRTGADMRGLGGLAAVYLAVLTAGFGARWAQSYLMQAVGQRVMADLRAQMVTHLQGLSMSFFSRTPVGRLVTRVTNDVDALNELITSGAVAIFGDIFTMIGILAVMLWMDWRLALAVFAVLPIVYVTTERFRLRSREAYRAVRTRLARINAYLNEQITGMTVTQLFTQEPRRLRAFDDLNAAHLEASLTATRNFSQFYPAIQFLGALGVALLLWYGGGQIARGVATLGVLVAAIQYAERFFDPLRDLADKFNIFQAAMASSERIFRVLDEPVTIEDAAEPAPLAPVRGAIEFRDVWFAYGENGAAPAPPAPRQAGRETPREAPRKTAWALRGVSFAIRPGERVALVGHTGAGKTSVINLLGRFYDPQRGQVLVDGMDVRRLRQRDLRRHVGLVLQDVFLFSGTIADNIRLGDPAISDADVQRAAEQTGAARFIEALPRGYATELHERGAGLSSGQKQLIAFARALAAQPEILLILDEATSSVDAETEALIQRAMTAALRGRTAIVIAHRLSTVRYVDRILVLHKGRIVEEGTHDALLARGGIYATLYRLQFADLD